MDETHTIYRVADESYTYTMPRFRCYLCAILMSRDPPRLGRNAFGGCFGIPAGLSVEEGLDLLQSFFYFHHV